MVPAREVAQWRTSDEVWIDHATLDDGDSAWLRPVKRLTMWAVKVPTDQFLGDLPVLEWLDVRGGSAKSLSVVEGCSRLRYLQVNQVRGLQDLGQIAALTTLELLSLYGLPRVENIPSLAALTSLRRAEVGMMRGLRDLDGLLDAPGLEELLLLKHVQLDPTDADRIATHPSIRAFDWFAEDIPNAMWAPVVERVGKPRAKPMMPAEWFEPRS